MAATLINKEDISNFKFLPADVDRSVEYRATLGAAQRLGNEFKSKVEITFMSEDGPKKVETTVWSLTESYIQLKAGILIPLKSIISVTY